MTVKNKNRIRGISEPTNGAEFSIDMEQPYTVEIEIEGASDLLFHRWNVEDVEAKASATKGSKAKKTDNVEAYVWRNDKGEICLPGEYLRMAIVMAAKFRQDPRSPRKSAMDLFKAAVVPVTKLASLGKKKWDYEDKRRVSLNKSGINRTRPAFHAGWRAKIHMMVVAPEYVPQDFLREVVMMAGRLVGVGDFRPTFGRFDVVSWKVL